MSLCHRGAATGQPAGGGGTQAWRVGDPACESRPASRAVGMGRSMPVGRAHEPADQPRRRRGQRDPRGALGTRRDRVSSCAHRPHPGAAGWHDPCVVGDERVITSRDAVDIARSTRTRSRSRAAAGPPTMQRRRDRLGSCGGLDSGLVGGGAGLQVSAPAGAAGPRRPGSDGTPRPGAGSRSRRAQCRGRRRPPGAPCHG